MKSLKKPTLLCVYFFAFISLFVPKSAPINAYSDTITNQSQQDLNITKGIHLLYSWEFNQAEGLFLDIVKQQPQDPIGYFYLSMVTWSQLAAGFWSPEVVEEFLKRTQKTISIAKKQIQYNEANSATYFFLGGALGFKGRLQLMQHRYLSAYFLAAEAIEAFHKSLKRDPDNKDVLFGLGIYDYYTDTLSGVLRFLTYLLLHRGDKEEGLRKLHTAAAEARYSSIEAKSYLAYIYLFLESDLKKARILTQELAERFPNNPRFRFLLGVTYVQLEQEPEYKEVVTYFLQRAEENQTFMAGIWRTHALYLEAVHSLFQGQFQEARALLTEILAMADPSLNPFMAALPLFKIGMSYDLEGKREAAVEYYERVLALRNGAGAQFLAEKYMDEPATKKDPFLGY
jgi:tetratricopeptide (TPR) repeat protein